MSIIATCGHQVKDLDETIQCATKAWEIGEDGWVKAIHYQSLCKACYKEYQVERGVLYTEQEEINWLKETE